MRKAAFLLAASLLAGMVLGADGPPAKPADAKPGKPIASAGVLTNLKPDFIMLWVDGDEAPTKFSLADTFDKSTFGFPPKCKGVFVPDRVTFTYSKGDDGNKVLTMNLSWPLAKPPAGTVTGEVKFRAADGFWIAVKPNNGPLDGYAVGWPPGPVHEKVKALEKGDWVALKFHTDVERHRIDAIQMAPKPPPPPEKSAPVPVKPPNTPTTAPAVSVVTSQPAQSLDEQARAKLQLVQMYVDSGMTDRAQDALKDIIRLYPNTEAARTAKARLTELGG